MKEKKCRHCGTKENLRTNKNGVIYNCCVSCYKNIDIPLQTKKTNKVIKEKYGVSDLGELRQKRLIDNPIIKKEKETRPCKYCGTLENLVVKIGTKRTITFPACKDHWEQYQKDKDEIRKKSTMKKYGVERVMQVSEFKEKVFNKLDNKTQEEKNIIQEKKKKTNLERYGVEHAICLPEFQEKRKQSNIKKYGANYPILLDEYKQKQKDTSLKKYGVENYSSSEECKEKRKKANLEHYGFENVNSSEEIKNKKKENNLKKYGVEYPSSLDSVKAKRKQTNLQLYGVEYPISLEENKEKRKQTCLTRYGVDSPAKLETFRKKGLETFRKNFWSIFVKQLEDKKIQPCFTSEFYIDSSNKEFKYKCLKCNSDFISIGTNNQEVRCDCNKNRSKYEDELIEFLKSLFIENIKPNEKYYENRKWKYELDIFLPDKSIGIDFHGLYWHSSFYKKNTYHSNKFLYFKNKNIKLIQIFENEWLSKRDIVESIIKSKFGFNKTIYARSCEIKQVSNMDYNLFMTYNHLQDKAAANIKLGLFFHNELVCAISFGKNRFNKNSISYELIRFANKKGITVVGGFNKLLSFFEINYKPRELISFVDLRYFDGESYLKSGFIKEKLTYPNYFYFKPNNPFIIYNRISFQKHKLINKLDNFNPELSEYENMLANGYMRIYDAGNIKMKKTY